MKTVLRQISQIGLTGAKTTKRADSIFAYLQCRKTGEQWFLSLHFNQLAEQ